MNVACIKCGETGDNAIIAVDVATGDIHCCECDSTYTVADIEAHVAAWSRLIPWIKARPSLREAAVEAK